MPIEVPIGIAEAMGLGGGSLKMMEVDVDDVGDVKDILDMQEM